MNKKLIFAACFLSAGIALSAQEALKSVEEEYYDFLALDGVTERPALNYRTMSNSIWTIREDKTEVNELNPNVWADKNLGSYYSILDHNDLDTNRVAKTLDRSIKIRVYGPEIFTSYNSKVPFGSNDGALWQGRGWNTSLTAGIRAQGYGFSLTFKPQYAVSQNKSFDIMKSANPNQWGYFMYGCDAPQRFGDDTYKIFDWGDTDIRYTWKSATYVEGKVNDPNTGSKYWSVETCIPLKDMLQYTKGEYPKHNVIWMANTMRVQYRVHTEHTASGTAYYAKDSPNPSNWAWCPTNNETVHLPDRWGYLQFSEDKPGSTKILSNPSFTLRKVLSAVYEAEHIFAQNHGAFTQSLLELSEMSTFPKPYFKCVKSGSLLITVNKNTFYANATSVDGTLSASITDDRFFTLIKN